MKNKPVNLKYTDLCIYIDKTVYERDENNNPIALRKMAPQEEETVYNYLYMVIRALTYKKKYSLSYQDLENFIFDFTTEVFLRLTSCRQDFSKTFKDKHAKRTLVPIKSVLNYIKSTLNFSVIDYRKANFKEVLNPDYDKQSDLDGCKEFLERQIRESYQRPYSEILLEEFEYLPSYLDEILDNSMFKHNTFKRNTLRLSILLTINNFITLPNKYKLYSKSRQQNYLKSQLETWRENICLWQDGADISKELVLFYTQKLFARLDREVSQEESRTYLPENIVKEILSSARSTYNEHNTLED